MDKIINFQDKVKDIEDKKNEIYKKLKKAFNKRTTFHFNYYELFVLITELCENILYYEDIVKDFMTDDFFDEEVKYYSYKTLKTTRLVKRLYKMYLNNDCFSDSKIQLTLSDMETCMETLEMGSEVYMDIESKKDGTFTFNDRYEEFDKYDKTVNYLYITIKNKIKLILEKAELLWKQGLNKKELKKYEEVEKIRESHIGNKRYAAEEILYDLYKDHYLNEYRTNIQFIYESTAYMGDHILWSSYFVKGNSKFNKFMAKYHYHRESKNFVYYYEEDIEEQEEMSSDIDYFPVGWRFFANVPTEEEYEEEMFASLKIKEQIKNSEEMKNFKFQIIDYEEKQDIHNDFYMLNENLLDKFEIVIDTYCGCGNIIYPDGRVGYEFDEIMSLNYQY